MHAIIALVSNCWVRALFFSGRGEGGGILDLLCVKSQLGCSRSAGTHVIRTFYLDGGCNAPQNRKLDGMEGVALCLRVDG